jgi:hypothetical protein
MLSFNFLNLTRAMGRFRAKPAMKQRPISQCIEELETRFVLSTLSVSGFRVPEEIGRAHFFVNLSSPSNQTVTVDFTLIDGTATAGNDYLPFTNHVIFSPGTTSQQFAVEIVDDSLQEPEEEFSIQLSNAVNATIAAGSPQFIINASDASSTPVGAEIDVELSGTMIPDNSPTPIGFGTVQQNEAAPEITFTITNAGDQALSVEPVSLDSGDFEVSQQPATSVAPGDSTTFRLRMLTNTTGAKFANVVFSNGDGNGKDPFNFNVSGTVDPAPSTGSEIEVRVGSNLIVDDSPLQIDFGAAQLNTGSIELPFTIINIGDQSLSIGTVFLENDDGFEVSQQPATSIAPGDSTTFRLRMLTDVPGSRSADVRFSNTDANGDENPFNFKVSGTVNSPQNNAPIAQNGISSLNQKQTITIDLGLLVADAETPDANLTYFVGGPSHGLLTGNGQLRQYTPNSNFIGVDTFSFSASDGDLTSNTAIVTITISDVTGPTVTLLTPNTGKFLVGQTITIQATASDPSGISHVWIELYKGGTAENNRVGYIRNPGPGTGNISSFDWTIPAALGGHPIDGNDYIIKWIAFDNSPQHTGGSDTSDALLTLSKTFIQTIPDIMHNMGWTHSEALQRQWFGRSSSDFPGINDTTIKMDWILKYARAKNAYEKLFNRNSDKYFASGHALEILRTNLEQQFNLLGSPNQLSFGDFTKRGFSLHDQQTQFSPVLDVKLDDLGGSLGRFNFYAVPQGQAIRNPDGSIFITIFKVGVYAHDSYDFNDDIPLLKCDLGAWQAPNKVRLTDKTGYTCVNNIDYRNFAAATGQGGNFFVFSDVKEVTLKRPITMTLRS